MMFLSPRARSIMSRGMMNTMHHGVQSTTNNDVIACALQHHVDLQTMFEYFFAE
jgi:hypothetical protein